MPAAVLTAAALRIGRHSGEHQVVASDAVWTFVSHPRGSSAAHGWKIHVSARGDSLFRTLDVALPVLDRHGCTFKVANDVGCLLLLNSGLRGPAVVGKAITVYPGAALFPACAEELAAALTGFDAAVVLGDRRVDPAAPVYYRYGPFSPDWQLDAHGQPDLVMRGPDGSVHPGAATVAFDPPAWAHDPLSARASARRGTGREYFSSHGLQVLSGISRRRTGNVYRCVTTSGDRPVVVKQAWAYVGEDEDGVDARARLTNERDVLARLQGATGFPELVDHEVGDGLDHLVTSDCGSSSLRQRVRASGPLSLGIDAKPSQSWFALGTALSKALDEAHVRGVVVRDLNPSNVVLDAHGTPSIVDLGASWCGGRPIRAVTLGYANDRQHLNAAPLPGDDLWALGATLFFAACGCDPVHVCRSSEENSRRSLTVLDALGVPGTVSRIVQGLLCEDPATQGRAVAWLRDPLGAAMPPQPTVVGGAALVGTPTSEDLADTVRYGVAGCLEAVERFLAADPASPEGLRLGLRRGAAGLGAELLHHLDVPDVRGALEDLLDEVAVRTHSLSLPPSLAHGGTGIHLVLAQARHRGVGLRREARTLGSTTADLLDLADGTAGLGLGHLRMAELSTSGERASHLCAARAAAAQLVGSWDLRRALDGPDTDVARMTRASLLHGNAGALLLLLELARMDEEGLAPPLRVFLDAGLEDLLDDCRFACRPGGPASATPRYASSCWGLPGLGTILLVAGEQLRRPELTAAAVEAGRVVAALLPRVSNTSRCCGLSGAGLFLARLVRVRGDDVVRAWLDRATRLLVTRTCDAEARTRSPLDLDSATRSFLVADHLALARKALEVAKPPPAQQVA